MPNALLARCIAAARAIVVAKAPGLPAVELVLGDGVALVYNTTHAPILTRLRPANPDATVLDPVQVQPGDILLLHYGRLFGVLLPARGWIDSGPFADLAVTKLEAVARDTSLIRMVMALDGRVVALERVG